MVALVYQTHVAMKPLNTKPRNSKRIVALVYQTHVAMKHVKQLKFHQQELSCTSLPNSCSNET